MTYYTISIFVAFIGFSIAAYIRHKKTKKEPMICPMRSNCSDVIQSDFSKFFNIPIELLGILYYAVVALGYGAKLIWPEAYWIGHLLVPATTIAFLFSIYLTFIQIFALRKLCTWCLTSAALCTILVVLTFLGSWDVVIPFLEAYRTPIVLVHLLGMALGLGAAAMADLFFFKFLRDFRISEMEASVLRTFSEVIWFALGIIIVSGVGLFLPDSATLLTSSKFLMKMVVITVIVVNGALLNLLIAPKLVHITFKKEHHHKKGELHTSRRLAFLLGPVSLISWLWAFVLGGLRGVPFSFGQILAIYIGTIVIGMLIGLIFDRVLVNKASK